MVIGPMTRGRSIHSKSAQDAREGGENPSLPRNCERTCLMIRRWSRQENQPEPCRAREEAVYH